MSGHLRAELHKQFAEERFRIDTSDPKWCTWVDDKTHRHIHITEAYNEGWKTWINDNPNATREDALALHKIFPDLDENDDPVADDWNTMFHMSPGHVPAEWREARRLAEVVLENDDYCVDLGEAENLGVLRRFVRDWSPTRSRSNRIDLSDLVGGERQVTCAAAAWLATRKLANGSRPRGLRYLSKHGANLACWALWVPVKHGEGIERAVRRYVWRGVTLPVDANDRQLIWAANQLGLKVW